MYEAQTYEVILARMLQKALSVNSNLDTREGSLVWLGNAPAAVELQNLYILIQLERRDKNHQSRWNKIWADPLCQKYKRPEHEDHWLWNYAFYNAPVEDLQHIFDLIRKG